MKRLIAVFLMLITLLSLCACAGNSDVTPEEKLDVSPEELLIGYWGIVSHTKNDESVDNANYEMCFFDDGSCELYCEGVVLKSLYWNYQDSESSADDIIYELRLFADDATPDRNVSLKYSKEKSLLSLDVKDKNSEWHRFVFKKSDEKFEEVSADKFGPVNILGGEWEAKALLEQTGEYCFIKDQAKKYVIKSHDDTRVYCDGEYITKIEGFEVAAKNGESVKRLLTNGTVNVESSDKNYELLYDVYTDNLIIKIVDEEEDSVEYMIFVKKDTEMTGAEFAERILMNAYGDGVKFTGGYVSRTDKTVKPEEVDIKPALIINDDGTYKFSLNGETYYNDTWKYSGQYDSSTPAKKFLYFGESTEEAGNVFLRIYSGTHTRIQLFMYVNDELDYQLYYFEKE